ncbi:hypothetical protein C2S53_016979 [Perilla frutescens var. hirtella]|uniref:KIB1-4 beta-propeller domain-containing protein n=1 Tax=Perilla frutescens var. hirtella TaxID=608512 RepID=A0AAD4IZH5_PERFH|nr:hypothetical protein C2S53_016979 [Perilla frutescens var. hirtella]
MAPPYLMLPLFEETNGVCLHSLKHKNSYSLNLLEKIIQNFQCVGSCNGWLAFLDESGNPFLRRAFSTFQFNLPPKKTLQREVDDSTSTNIVKVILSSLDAVIIMYNLGLDTKIAFWRDGDENWRHLDGCRGETYYDIIFCDRTNMLLALGPGPSLESWDFTQTNPKKTMQIIQDSCPKTLQLAHQTFPTDLFSSQWYLASSPSGQIFMIVRYIGEFVRYDGEVVYEGDTLTDYAAEPLVCPYKTTGFHVFGLDLDRREWVDVESLNDLALFVGVNQSVMLSSVENEELKRNAIYFTDDYWERMDEDYSYGGHDMGVYSLEDASIQPILDCGHQQKFHPPPFWLTLPR